MTSEEALVDEEASVASGALLVVLATGAMQVEVGMVEGGAKRSQEKKATARLLQFKNLANREDQAPVVLLAAAVAAAVPEVEPQIATI